MCYSEMELAVGKKGRTPKKKRQKTAEESATAAPSWIEVLTDMLLGFLSQPSQLWRNVTEQVWTKMFSDCEKKHIKCFFSCKKGRKFNVLSNYYRCLN